MQVPAIMMIRANTSISKLLQPIWPSVESCAAAPHGPFGHNEKRTKKILEEKRLGFVTPKCWPRRSGSCGADRACSSMSSSRETCQIYDLQCWTPGPLYGGGKKLTLQRWHFWRDGYSAVALRGDDEKKAYSEECRDVAAKAAHLMDSIEGSMTFQQASKSG